MVRNFTKTMRNVGKTHCNVRVVSDQIGTPAHLYLACLLVDMCESEKYGYYHTKNVEVTDEMADLKLAILAGMTYVVDFIVSTD